MSSLGELQIPPLPAAETVIVVPTFGAFDCVRRLLLSLESTTPADIPILLVDDAHPGETLLEACGDLISASHLNLITVRLSVNHGFVGTCNLAFAAAGDADVIVCNSDVRVTPGWFEGLRDAALSSTLVASASAFGSNAGILTVPIPGLGNPLIDGEGRLDAAAVRIREFTPWHPELPTAVGHLMYLRRAALSVVGDFDERFSPGYGEEVQWSRRALRLGFRHVAADTVVVHHEGGRSFGANPKHADLQHRHEMLLANDFPGYHSDVRTVLGRDRSPLGSALLRASVAVRGLHVRVDCRGLGAEGTGTERGALETSRALAAMTQITRLEIVVNDESVESYAEALPGICVLGNSAAATSSTLSDIAFRPCHLRSLQELRDLAGLGRRLCFQQLDFIAYSNPAYFSDSDAWHSYRLAIDASYAVADGVAFLSNFVEGEAEALGLHQSVAPTRVVGAGLDHVPRGSAPRMPAGLAARVGSHYVLIVGASFLHKNRSWALSVFEEMMRLGYSGRVVLAGPHPNVGSSVDDEARLLDANPALRARVVELPWLPAAELKALIGAANLVLYPTLSEGFGLVPLEAARLGTPTLSSQSGGLEVLVGHLEEQVDLAAAVRTAEAALRIIDDGELRMRMVEDLVKVADRFPWSAVAEQLVDLFVQVTNSRSAVWSDATLMLLEPQWTARLRDHHLRHRLLPRGSRRSAVAAAMVTKALDLRWTTRA